jgi:hypothetical protein
MSILSFCNARRVNSPASAGRANPVSASRRFTVAITATLP